MKILINGTELNVISALAHEYASGKRELRITIPQTEIEHAELKALVNGNTGEIVLTKDNGTTEVFLGYHTTAKITDMTEKGVEVFYVTIDCVGEAERRALEAEYRAKEAEKTAQALAQQLEQQNQALAALNQQLLVTQLAVVEMHEASKAEPEVEPEVIGEGEVE